MPEGPPIPRGPHWVPRLDPSAHADGFAREHLPPFELWPALLQGGETGGLAPLEYPVRLNAAVELLDRMVDKGFGPRPCLRTDDFVWSYSDLLDHANRVAGVLVNDWGLVPGERVLLRDANTPMLAACWFAVLKAGGIAVTTMPQLRARELAGIAAKARIKYALCAAEFSEELEKARQAASRLENAPLQDAPLQNPPLQNPLLQNPPLENPLLEKILFFRTPDASGLETRAARQPSQFANVPTSHDDVALIGFTSGTTGEAKATLHFHRDVLAVCDCFPPYALQAGPDDIFCGSPPLAFTFGLGGLLLFPLRAGASVLLLPKATAEGLPRAIERHGCTVCFTAPTLYRAMLEQLPRFDLSSLRKCVSAGETLPLPVFEAWLRQTGLRIIDGIGSTEMLHIFIAAAGDDIRPGATGKAVPGYEARIVDEQGRPLPPGVPGRLAVRGPTGCRYLEAPEQQRKYVRGGWNLTGDLYRMDEDGYFWYEGRTDDMIVSAGYKIPGLEIEAALLDHPSVLECAVVGAPDPERGEIVKAFVVLRPEAQSAAAKGGEDLRRALQNHVKAQIAPYKYPRAIEFVAELPRTATGKLQRFRLREPRRLERGEGE